MITFADDFGRFKADAAILRKAFPYDDFTIEQIAGWRRTIESVGLVKTYERENELYAYHPRWRKYQGGRKPAVRPDKKTPKLPPPDNQQTTNGQHIDDTKQTQIRIDKKRTDKIRKEKIRNSTSPSAAKDKNLELAEKMQYHYHKEFSTYKKPPFSLVMKMAYESSPQTTIDAMIKMGEYLREGKEIKDYPAYFLSLCKKEK